MDPLQLVYPRIGTSDPSLGKQQGTRVHDNSKGFVTFQFLWSPLVLFNLWYLFSGLFPLSEVSLLSEEERDQYIPTIRTFIRVLDDSLANDGLDSKDINLLVDKCKEFSKLFPQSPCTNINNCGNMMLLGKLHYLRRTVTWQKFSGDKCGMIDINMFIL